MPQYRIWYTVPNGITHAEFTAEDSLHAIEKFMGNDPHRVAEMVIPLPDKKPKQPSSLPKQLLF